MATRREEIAELLKEDEWTICDLALRFKALPKDISTDLEHVRYSVKPLKLVINPAVCEHCGFVFKDRERVSRPTKCPKCKGEKITEPKFRVK